MRGLGKRGKAALLRETVATMARPADPACTPPPPFVRARGVPQTAALLQRPVRLCLFAPACRRRRRAWPAAAAERPAGCSTGPFPHSPAPTRAPTAPNKLPCITCTAKTARRHNATLCRKTVVQKNAQRAPHKGQTAHCVRTGTRTHPRRSRQPILLPPHTHTLQQLASHWLGEGPPPLPLPSHP